jgi:hypothetical protein
LEKAEFPIVVKLLQRTTAKALLFAKAESEI